jgi:hypothetical protein
MSSAHSRQQISRRPDAALKRSKPGARSLLLILAGGRGSWLADDLPRSGGKS